MDVFETVSTVLAVRDFQSKPIPANIVDKIVASAWLTASSKNLQPWYFIVVQDREQLRRLGEIAKSGPYIAQAAMAVVVVIDRTEWAVSDGSRAIQSMALTAWSEGIGSNWVGFVGFGGMPDVNAFLNIPTDKDVLAVVPFGYPTRSIGKGKKNRKAMAEVIYWEKFGQSAK